MTLTSCHTPGTFQVATLPVVTNGVSDSTAELCIISSGHGTTTTLYYNAQKPLKSAPPVAAAICNRTHTTAINVTEGYTHRKVDLL
jgi:hypothetical protein